MKGSKEFFEELREGESYLNCFMTRDVYSGIDHELRELMVVNEVRQHNEKFKDDPIHKDLVKKYSQAKAELRDYEFKINHK